MKRTISRNVARVTLAASTILASSLLATTAMAQQDVPSPAPQAPAQPEPQGEIVVTGSRINSSGFTAPTPTQVLSNDDINKNAQPNVFTTVAQLPSLQGSTGASVGANGTSTGVQGLSTLSLRGLSPIRTLTLLDGQRVVGANVTGVADVSLFPQLLIKRVDVVTGGASASYGSDAVGGVVNFATDTRFEGLRTNVLGGISTYGDNANYTVQAAAGKAFLDNRLHVIVSGEYSREDGIPSAGFGVGSSPNGDGPNGRDWLVATGLINRSITNDGKPQYLYRTHVQSSLNGLYGLITSGPLAGTAFDKSGSPYPFRYGTECYNGSCVGGDLSGSVANGNSLMSELSRLNGYGRVGFDFAPDNEVYVTANVARVRSSNTPNPGFAQFGNLTMQCSNPYVPASIQQACASAGITSFGYGVNNAMFDNIDVNTQREQYRFVGGAKGRFAALGTEWRYDGYYEHGTEITDINVSNIALMPRYRAAINAVQGANGVITCADPVAVANGCSPLNIFGGATPSAAARDYIEPAYGPFQHTRQTQDVASVAFNGEPLSVPAGAVSVAFGGEYRHEFYRVTADPYGNGISGGAAYSSAYPADPLLSTGGGNWYAGNYRNGSGGYDVYEGFLELNVPIFNSDAIGKGNLNGAVRGTHYSTSGTVWTWKIGGTWKTPVDGVTLRGVTSRDIRAPNLSELYAAPVTSNRTGTLDPFTNRSLTVLQTTTGNPNLTPEIARNTEIGIVLSQPKWLPGLNISFDYYNIKIRDAIAALDAQTQINLCYGGVQFTCGSFDLTDPNAAYVTVQPFNFASIKTDGFDIETSYQTRLDGIGLPGRLSLRALATHTINFITDRGLPGTIPIQGAGVNIEAGAMPHWKLLLAQDWSNDKVAVRFQERWFSAGVLSNEYVVCTTGCPVSTVNNPTIDYNRVPGALYVDFSLSYQVTPKVQTYFKVDNLFNRDAANVPGNVTTPTLYDVIGRAFRIGVRANF
jgi:iron complex outermembrane recepter protein